MRRAFAATTAMLLILASSIRQDARAQAVPEPSARLGFSPGEDYRLADWAAVVEDFHAVDASSDRVTVVEAGRTTEDRPYIFALISAPETIARLDVHRDRQRRLHDPRMFRNAEEEKAVVEESKPVVLITCSIHSNEPASTLAAVRLLHQLATGEDRETREILDGVIVILVPSANPDGVDKVKTWYDRSRGRAWEGGGFPELYHRHAGHDTNRDWFMLNLPETRILTRILYREWFPTILYDVHEMSADGPRVFVPPYREPFNPNVDRRIRQSTAIIGAHMRADLSAAGVRGVVSSALFDDWWNGGARTTPERHNIVSVLTETASVRIATPVEASAEPRGPSRRRAGPPSARIPEGAWPGGVWRLGDVVDAELVCARSLLTLAARYRREFQAGLAAMARKAVDDGREKGPRAWVVPARQHDPGAAATMLRILHDSGVEIHRATEPFQAEGRSLAAGDRVILASQPYRGHVKDLMERQRYPVRVDPRGRIEAPYDVTGWTLPLMMGVDVVTVSGPLNVAAERLDSVARPVGAIVGEARPEGGVLTFDGRDNDDYKLLNRLLKAGVPVGLEASPGRFRIADDASTRARVEPLLDGLSTTLAATPTPEDQRADRVVAPRIGVYQSWVPGADEGWTRFVLDSFEYPYKTIHDADVQTGGLERRLDALIVPSYTATVLRRGYEPGQSAPEYTGGLGVEGARSIRRFVEAGGVLVCLEDACSYAIEELKTPVANMLQDVSSDVFLCPGSVLGATAEGDGRLTMGMPRAFSLYFDRSMAFDVSEDAGERGVRVAARYAASAPLQSGWMIGSDRIAGKPALVEVDMGAGRVVLFGFPPQHRGWTHGTYRLLFNALMRTAAP